MLLAGCTGLKLPRIGSGRDQPALVKVEIVFRDGSKLNGYMRGLKLGEDSTVYIGGATSTNLYDRKGNLHAVFNYAQVLYIKVVE